MIIFTHSLKQIFNEKVNVMLLFILPIPLALIPLEEGSLIPFGMYIFGFAQLFTAFLLGKRVIEDREKKLLLRIASSPLSFFRYLSEHLLACTVLMLGQIVVFLSAILLTKSTLDINIMALFTLYLTHSMMLIAFVLCWNAMFKSFSLSFAIFSGFSSIMALLSGLTIPIEAFPEIIQKMAMIIPTFWLQYGLTHSVHGNINHILLAYAVLLTLTALFLTVGSQRRFG